MAKVLNGVAVVTKVTARGLRNVSLALVRLSALIARLTGRGSLAFVRSSSETKTATLTGLGCAAGGLLLSPFVDIMVLGSPVSSVLVLPVLGLLFGILAGYSAVKKVRGIAKGDSAPQ